MLTTETLHIDPATLRPPHAVRDAAHSESLAASMRAGGWQGRPILAFGAEGEAPRPLTGSHRIAAARAAGLDTIPVLVLSGFDGADADELALYEALDEALRGRGDLAALDTLLRDSECPEAAALAEIAAEDCV
jgi:ParB-like chromosome segregation protein Spo0J